MGNKKPFDIIKEIEKIKKCICCMGLDCKTNISSLLNILNIGKEGQVLTTGSNNNLYWNNTRYVHDFLIADFVGSDIFVAASTHKRGTNPIVQVVNNSTGYIAPPLGVSSVVNTIKIATNGDITMVRGIAAFNGKIIIM